MKFERVQCLVRLNQKGHTNLTTIVKAGPDAISVTEIPILRMRNDIADGLSEDECSISLAQVVGEYEATKGEEYERLRLKYGEKDVAAQYPQGRLMPSTLADCELPPGCLLPAKAKKKAEPTAKQARAKLEAAGVDVPAGNLTADDFNALAEEHGVALV